MDQLHEELKFAVESESEEEEETDDDEDEEEELAAEDMNNANSAGDSEEPPANCYHSDQNTSPNRRPSFYSISSHSSLDYETCDSGLSSERGDTPCDGGMESGDEVDTNDS